MYNEKGKKYDFQRYYFKNQAFEDKKDGANFGDSSDSSMDDEYDI